MTKLKDFYESEIGVLVQSVLQKHIDEIWPDVRGYRIMGCGYALPYLEGFCKQNPERVIAMMPKSQGAQYWPQEGKNICCFCDEENLPLESASVDRALLVHYLEGCDNLQDSVREIWRVLKAEGKALVVVPNRMGAWAHAEWSPFGYGRPFTMGQIEDLLCKKLFERSRYESALFMPPMPNLLVMRCAHIIENMGGAILPFVAGVHIIEINKRIFAGVDKTGGGSTVLAKTRELLGGKGAAVPQGYIDPN